MFWRARNSFGQFIYQNLYARHSDLSNIGSVVSFTFDDFPETALFNGGGLLRKYGVHGTYYLTPGLYGEESGVGRIVTEKDVRICLDDGHEIGHHTFSHLNCAQANRREIVKDIEKANKKLAGVAAENFAFPFGDTTRRSRKIIRPFFNSCRGIQSGINRNLCDLLDLKATAIYSGRNNLDFLEKMIMDVRDNGGWLIFYTHDVCASPSEFGCTEEELGFLINTTLKNGIPIVSVKDALAKI